MRATQSAKTSQVNGKDRDKRAGRAKAAARGNGTLSDRIYRALKRDIVTGVHRPGDALTENLLARRYKGSRTPVREAAVRLEHERLLRIFPNRGYFVSHITPQQLNEVYEFRLAVECAAAELAARKTLAPDLFDRVAGLAEMKYTIDDRASYERFIVADTEFHVGIARLSRNHLLVRAVEEARCQMERIMYAAIDIGYFGELPLQEHIQILQAIQERCPERARRLMYDHIFGSKDKVLELASSGS